MLALSPLPLLTAVAVVLVAFIYSRRKRSFVHLPPGPKGWPVIGNVFDIPPKFSWFTFAKWKDVHGDIIYLEAFGLPIIVLNSFEDVHHILTTRSAITAGRPRMIMANELMDWGWNFAHMSHTDEWRRHRRTFYQYFRQQNVASHIPVIHKATTTLLGQLIRSPNNFRKHMHQYTSTVILKLTYDHEVRSEDDYYIALVNRAIEELSQVIHIGSSLVDVFPILRHVPAWFPGAHFKKTAEVSARLSKKLRNVPFEQAKNGMAQGNLNPCFVSDGLAQKGVDEGVVKNCAGLAYLAGFETMASLTMTFFLVMVHHPDVQLRAQKEIDSVTGSSRLPVLEDRSSLPYIDAIISELLRWNPPVPLSFPHRLEQADIYKGYYFPAGTIIIPNVWAIFHDETTFPEPDKFKPERFLDGGMDPDLVVTMGVFGYGRRICPGRYLALNSAWLVIARILSTFNISPKRDEGGKARLGPPEVTNGLVVHPTEFEADIVPRSEQALQLMRDLELGFEG